MALWGDVNVALNRLVAAGVIARFWTNLAARRPPAGLHVVVSPPEPVDREGAEVIRELVAVKGIGEWTAHMFLMFTLHRPDVLPTGDQGIKNAVMAAYGLDAVPKPDALTEIAEPWRPHRTRACLYLWRSLDNEPG